MTGVQTCALPILAYELATNDEQRQLFRLLFGPLALPRLFVAPPDVPADRMAALRQAYEDAVADPDFIGEARRLGFDVAPANAGEISAFIALAHETPPSVARKAFEILERGR